MVLNPGVRRRRQDRGPLLARSRRRSAAFPAHWAPVDVKFYTGTQFPARYRNGAFIAFHGSWNRSPEPQAGYNVTFQPFVSGKPAGPFEVFARRLHRQGDAGQSRRRRGASRRHRAGARRHALHRRQPARQDLEGRLHRRASKPASGRVSHDCRLSGHRPSADPPDVTCSALLITQPDHAALSATIMRGWESGGLPESPRHVAIMLAIQAHDNGWQEVDAEPCLDPATGRVLDFVHVPEDVRHAVWQRGVARLDGRAVRGGARGAARACTSTAGCGSSRDGGSSSWT